MIDEFEENGEASNRAADGGYSSSIELTLASIKDYMLAKGGKVKYAELYADFRERIVDSTTGTQKARNLFELIFDLTCMFFRNREEVPRVRFEFGNEKIQRKRKSFL